MTDWHFPAVTGNDVYAVHVTFVDSCIKWVLYRFFFFSDLSTLCGPSATKQLTCSGNYKILYNLFCNFAYNAGTVKIWNQSMEMENSSCIASLQLLSLQATAVMILYVMVWTTWSWVQFCPKLNWTSQTIVSIWWSESHRLNRYPFHCSKWLGQIDRQNLYMMTRSEMMFCTMTLTAGDISMASVMLHVSWPYGHFVTWRIVHHCWWHFGTTTYMDTPVLEITFFDLCHFVFFNNIYIYIHIYNVSNICCTYSSIFV